MVIKYNRKIAKAKNTHLSYLESVKENNMSLTPTTPDDVDFLIGNIKVKK